MKKSLSFLILIAIFAYLGFSSCGPKEDPWITYGCGASILWGNQNTAFFSPIALYAPGTFYKLYSGGTNKVLCSENITSFADIFSKPAGTNITSVSSVKVQTVITKCFPDGDAWKSVIDQTYKKCNECLPLNYSIPLSSSDLENYYNCMDMVSGNGVNTLKFWRSNRAYKTQGVEIFIYSGPYEDIYGRWVKLYWFKAYNAESVDSNSMSVEKGDVLDVNAGAFISTASIIDITPNHPFVGHLYKGDVLTPCTLENVTTTTPSNKDITLSNKEVMTLEVALQ